MLVLFRHFVTVYISSRLLCVRFTKTRAPAVLVLFRCSRMVSLFLCRISHTYVYYLVVSYKNLSMMIRLEDINVSWSSHLVIHGYLLHTMCEWCGPQGVLYQTYRDLGSYCRESREICVKRGIIGMRAGIELSADPVVYELGTVSSEYEKELDHEENEERFHLSRRAQHYQNFRLNVFVLDL